jgi:Dolichyl-phosphate-mannose-protein mannosyltransferase
VIPRIRGEHWLVLLLAVVRTLFCAYRASHQSIVLDEAYTYNRYLGSWHDVYWLYEANNHVLFSILAKLSIRLFGLSELALRLPTVIAGFFLIWGVFRILERTVSRPVRWIALIALSLHPLILDLSVAARGYGLSVALLVWAIDFAMARKYAICGVLAALAISASLPIIPAAIGLMTAILLVEQGSLKDRLKAFAIMAAPFQAVVVAINFGALRTATLQSFSTGVGFTSWQDFLRDVIHNSIHTAHRAGLFGSPRIESFIAFVILPAILIFGAASCFVRNRPTSSVEPPVELISAITLFVAILGLVGLHRVLNVNYPEDRLGLYLLVLFGLTWAIAVQRVGKFWVFWTQAIMAALLVVQFVTQFDPTAFAVWKYDRESKTVALRLQDLCKGKPDGSVSVSTTWLHQPAMEFYRVALNIRALRPIDWPRQTEFTGHDYYVFNVPDTWLMKERGIRVLFEDQRSGIALGAR